MHRAVYFTAALVLATAFSGLRDGNASPNPGPVRLRILGPQDLQTNVSESHRITWDRPVRSATGAQLPYQEVLAGIQRAVRIVELPSGKAVPGRWVTLPPDDLADRPSLSFVPNGPVSSDWEALMVDSDALPAQFRDPNVATEPVVRRFSRKSRPFVVETFSRRIEEANDGTSTGYPATQAGNDMLIVRFSEPVGSLKTVHRFVQIEALDQSIHCTPHVPLRPEDVPVTVVAFQCSPLAQDHALRVRVAGALTSKSGVSLARAVGRAAQSDTTLDLVLHGNDVARPAVDSTVFERIGKVPGLRGTK